MTSLVPQSFIPGYRLQSGTDLNVALANPQWSTSMSFEATTSGTAATSAKIVNTLTNITSATANAGVTVPRSAIGRMLYIINSSGNTVKVYPEGDATINGLSSYSLPTNQAITLYGVDTTSWQVDSSGGGGGTVYASPTNIQAFGAVGDAQTVNWPGQSAKSVSIASGTNTLTVTGAGFAAGDVGKAISVEGAAAPVSGIPKALVTTISAFISSTQVQLAANASTTLTATNGLVTWGTDNTTAIQNAMNSSASAVYVPIGSYLTTGVLFPAAGQTVFGDGYNSNIRQITPDIPTIRTTNGNVIRNLRLTLPDCTNSGYFAFTPAGVWIRSCNNVTVENNFIEGGNYGISGVYVILAKNVTVKNNLIYGNKWSAEPNYASFASDVQVYGVTRNIIIDGNFCLSNNSQGIGVGLGTDADFAITNNVCVTLDPTTCYPGGTWAEAATGGNRRTGILISYNNDTVGGPRCVIDGNIVRNTRWTGIYKQGTSQGPVIISNNVITNTGYDTANTISGGIYIFQSGQELVEGNYVSDFQNTQQVGAITVYAYIPPTLPAVISNNVIENSVSYGMMLGTACANVVVENNKFLNNTLNDILVNPSPGVDRAGHKIIGNTMIRPSGSTQASIREAGSTSTKVLTIKDNTFIGGDNTTSNTNFNTAFYCVRASQYYSISGNTISNFYTGIHLNAYQITNRYADISYNKISSCTNGIYIYFITSPPVPFTVPLLANTFANNITADVAPLSTAAVGKQCLRLGNTLIFDEAATPTTGSWVAGDKVFYTAPTAGTPWGAVCTVGGQFGSLAGVTANATNGSPDIVVNSATTLAPSMAITIAGVTGSYIIKSISGTTVTLTSNCVVPVSPVVGGAVAYVAPTFAQFAVTT